MVCVCVCCACVCDVFKRVWFDCDVLCDGVWSVVCVGVGLRVGFMCLCDVCFEGVGVFCLWCLFVCVFYVFACLMCDVVCDDVWFVILHVLFAWVFCIYVCVMCL